MSEPYLDLMVEVNWASGRLVREYTFLLDPPGVSPTPVEPVAPVRIGAAPPRPAAAPAAPASARGHRRLRRRRAASARPRLRGRDQYAVKRGDTLSKIANEYKPPSATLEQMMVALFNANQGAFDGGNMNRLRAGRIVTMPPADAAASTPPVEAAKVVRLQASDWRSYRDRVAGTAPASDATTTRTSAGGRSAPQRSTPYPRRRPGATSSRSRATPVPASRARRRPKNRWLATGRSRKPSSASPNWKKR